MQKQKLTASEVGKIASQERWHPTIPKATHSGILFIGEKEIACDVLEDGRRVLRQKTLLRAMGKGTLGGYEQERGKELNLPTFMTANNLRPYFGDDFIKKGTLIFYKDRNGKKCFGYEASLLPEACKVYVQAEHDGVLQKNQLPIASVCKIMLYSLATVGITALVDECTGYQKVRERNELQKLLDLYIAKELQPWTKRFPNEFFDHFKRHYGYENIKGTPHFIGHFINKYVYKELSPEILDELKRLNPVIANGKRLVHHHRLLTKDMGCPALDKQIQKVTNFLSATDSIDEFAELYDKSKRI